MIFDFLQPIPSELIKYIEELSNETLGRNIELHTVTSIPLLGAINVAIITINEYRSEKFENEDASFVNFRKNIYKLFPGNWSLKIADLGTIQQGNTVEDTYFLVRTITEKLLKKKILPIIIGGTQDLTYPLYRAYDNLEQMVNLVTIDSKFDFAGKNKTPANSYLSSIIVEEPNNLSNYTNIGYQTYYNSQEEIDLIEKLYFEAYRLGDVCKSLAIAEPVLRDADLVSFDLTSVATSGIGASFSPNGFNGREICSLARYSGISDKISTFSVFNFFNSEQEVSLLAQMVWYFLEGVQFRSNEYPFTPKDTYYKYIVPIDDNELVFYKSDITARWWIEIKKINSGNNSERNTLLPCTYTDYLAACEQQIPERWWKAQRRFLV